MWPRSTAMFVPSAKITISGSRPRRLLSLSRSIPSRGLRAQRASTSIPRRASWRAAPIITESPTASGATPAGAPAGARRASPQSMACAVGAATSMSITVKSATRISSAFYRDRPIFRLLAFVPWKKTVNDALRKATGYQLERAHSGGGRAAAPKRRRGLRKGDRLVKAPVFVMCTLRSGSTLLRVLLNSHSQIHAPHELHLRYISVSLDKKWSERSMKEMGLDAAGLRYLLWDQIGRASCRD